MLLNYLKIAWRNLVQHKVLSAINVMGLSIGLACGLVIALYVSNQFSFDRFHRNYRDIYRVNKITSEKGKEAQLDALTPGLLAPELAKELPEIRHTARFRPWFTDLLVQHDSVKLKMKEVSFADAAFLQIFNFPLLEGDAASALKEPFTAVLTETAAHNLFGDEDPMGRTLNTLNNIPVKVTGIARDLPQNSSLQFSMLISWNTLTTQANADQFSWMNNWTAQVGFTFLQFRGTVQPDLESKKISSILHLHFPENEFSYQAYLQPLDDIHLHSKSILFADNFRTASDTIIYILMGIAVFILLIACFNFINLSTVAALGRVKESGVQKMLGARRIQLVGKYLLESFLMCTLSMGLALVLVSFSLPLFNRLAQSNLEFEWLSRKDSLASLFVLWMGMGLLSGLYPAIFLSRFRSVEVFKKTSHPRHSTSLRRGLVTMQFALSIFLVVATLAVKRQMVFLGTRDLGFDKEQLVVIPISNTSIESNAGAFIHALQSLSSVSAVSASDNIPGKGFNGFGIKAEGFSSNDKLMANVLETDANFVQAYGIPVKEGRFFSPGMPSDTTDAIVINEAMARFLGWNKPIGKSMELYQEAKGKVIGVIKDFNFASLRENIHPLAILLRNHPQWISVKIKPGQLQSSIAELENKWKSFERQYPFEYSFMDEEMNKYYQTDKQLLRVLGIFSGLAIFIAAMGLLGLSMYTLKMRTREISIRKVLGASSTGIITLLSKDFLKPVALGAIVAIPSSAWSIRLWLQDFAYRTEPGWWIYASAALLSTGVALFTVGIQALKAAQANPTVSLRNE